MLFRRPGPAALAALLICVAAVIKGDAADTHGACAFAQSGRLSVASDCQWQGVIDGGPELCIQGAVAAAGRSASSTPATPVVWAPAAASAGAGASTGASGTVLRLERLVLVGFDVATSTAGPQPFLWPSQLVASGAALAMTDVRLVLASQQAFDALRAFFAADSKVFQWTDNSSFVHVARWSDSRTQLLSVGILLQAPSSAPNPLRLAPPLVRNALVAGSNASLVPYLLANAAAVTPQPLLLYVATNVSLGLHPALPASGIQVGRPVVLVGLQSLVTSVDFEMAVNQLNATASSYSNATLAGLVLENIAPGDAATSTVASPFSIAITNNLWAVFYNRTAANNVRLALFNCTMVVPQESEMAYVTYMFTLFTSTLPYLRQQTSFYTDVLHMTTLQFVPGPGSNSITVQRLRSWYHWWNNVVLTTQQRVSPALALPPRPLVLSTTTRASPLVQAVHTAEDLQADSQQDVLGDREHILLLLSNISLSDISTRLPNGSASNPVIMRSGMAWMGTSPAQAASEGLLDSKQGSSSSDSSVSLDFGFQLDAVVAPASATKDGLQLQQLVLRGLPQGPNAAAAVVDGRRVPQELFTVLLWSISRDRADASQLALDGITLHLPGPELQYLLSAGSTATDFVVELAGSSGHALTFQDVVQLEGLGLHAGGFQGPGVSAINITMRLDPAAAASMPRGYVWPNLSSLPLLAPATSQPGWVVPVVAVSVSVAAVAAVLGVAVLLYRRRRHAAAGGVARFACKLEDGSLPHAHSCPRCFEESDGPVSRGGGRSPRVAAGRPLQVAKLAGSGEAGNCSRTHDSSEQSQGLVLGGDIVPLGHKAFHDSSSQSLQTQLQHDGGCLTRPGSSTTDGMAGLGDRQQGGRVDLAELLPHSPPDEDVASLRDVAVPVHIVSSMADHVAAGMQRWRAAVSSTTMLLMERRMDAAVLPVGSGASGSGATSNSLGRQGSIPQQQQAEDDAAGELPAAVGQQDRVPAAGTPPQLLLQELLGQGSFGCVYRATWRGKRVAVKVMQLPANALLEPQEQPDGGGEGEQQLSAADRQRRRRARQLQQNSPPHMAIMEAVVSSTMSHPNVVQVFTYMLNPLTAGSGVGRAAGQAGAGVAAGAAAGSSGAASEISGWELKLVMEFCSEGSLRDALDCGLLTKPGTFLAPSAVLTLAHDVAAAMLHLHSEGVVHGDLKAGNVMLTSSTNSEDAAGGRVYAAGSEAKTRLVAKVADFGLAMPLAPADTHATLMARGTPTHMSPELFMSGHVSRASDVFAYGILLFEVITGQRAYAGVPIPLLPHEVARQGLRPQWPPGLPPGCRDLRRLAEACWAQQPQDRPSFPDILQTLDFWAAGGHGWPWDKQQLAAHSALCAVGSANHAAPAAATSQQQQQQQQPALAPAAAPSNQQLQTNVQQPQPGIQMQGQQAQHMPQQQPQQQFQVQVLLDQPQRQQPQLQLPPQPAAPPAGNQQQPQGPQPSPLSLVAGATRTSGGPRNRHMSWSEVDCNGA